MSTFTDHVATEGQQVFTISFPYLDITHVRVMRNGVLCLIPSDYEWIGPSTFRMREPQPAGTLIQIRRFTQDDALVTYQNSAVLTAEDLNVATLQNLYRTQELQDQINNYVESAVIRFAVNGSPGQLTAQDLIDAAAQEILNSELLAELQARIGDIDINAETIITQTVRLDDMQAIVDSLTDIDGVGIATFIVAEQEARIEGDTAIVNDIALLGAKSGDGLSWILDMNKVKVSPTESFASRLSSIASTMAANSAAITSEATTRASADSALSSSITGLSATVSTNYSTLSSAISTEQTARSTGDSTNATAITNLASTVSNNLTTVNAAISSEASTRASADTANASSITTLQATVNGHTSSISTLSSVVSGAGGLTAQWMVKTDVNGYVSGFGLYNSGATSDFIVLADKFAVVTPGQTAKVPFLVSGGTVYMQNVVIQDALIQNLTIAKLTTGSLNADMNMGTGKIIWSNGAYMKVAGVGFGSTNQFIEWYGPYQSSFSSCTEANAIQYLKTNGDAYFGGTLAAGILKVAYQTPDTSASASVTSGAFLTNGHTKTIVCSYGYSFTRRNNAGTGSVSGGGSATIVFEKSTDNVSWTTIDTLNVSTSAGTVTVDGDPAVKDIVRFSMGGSHTITDSTGATSTMYLRARMTARSLPTYGGTGTSGVVETQSTGFVCTET